MRSYDLVQRCRCQLPVACLILLMGSVPIFEQTACAQESDVVAEELVEAEAAVDENVEATDPAIELLDKATQKKLFAKRMSDLDSVVELCEEAIELGLPEENAQYAKELMAGSLFEKANQVLAPVLEGKLDRSWRQRRRMALESLEKAADIQPKHGDVQLLIAQLADLPDGDKEAGRQAAEKAVELLWENPARRSEALLTRSAFGTTPEEQLQDVEKAVAADKSSVDALRERAQFYLDLERTDEAIADLKKIVELDESDTHARELVIELLIANEKQEDALILVDELIDQDKTSAQGYLLRASIRLSQGDDDQALKDIEQAVDVEPNNTTALLLRAQVQANQGKHEESYADIERVLDLEPGSPRALFLRSTIAQIQGDFELAIRDLNRLLRRSPDNVEIKMLIASVYVMDKRPRRAIDIYTRIVNEDETEWEALRGRADAYLGVGMHQQAIEDYEKLIPLAGDDPGVLNNFAWVLATSPDDKVRDGKRAVELAEKACELTDYEAAHILSTLAAAHAETGDFEKAIEWSKKAVELHADDEIDEQLKEELTSYEAKRPWREKQEQEERVAEPEVSPDDLELAEPERPLESVKVPSDP